MKKVFYIVAAAASVLASCQKQNASEPFVGDADIRLSVEVPVDLQSKAMSKAEHTDVLYYEVWNSDWTRQLFPVDPAALESVPVTGGTATVDLTLVKGHTYNFIFWACNEAAAAYDVNDLQNVKINYDVIAQNGNKDQYDAFYSVDTLAVKDDFNERVVLRRPFAQLNFGASKMSTSLGDIIIGDTQVTVSNLATVFDTRNDVGIVPTSAPVTFKANGLATDELLLTNGAQYTWITMDYMLMEGAHDAVTVNASFTLQGTDAPVLHTVNNVPLSRNYRTNIVGDLFTSDAQLTIVVDPVFENPDNIVINF